MVAQTDNKMEKNNTT